MFLNRSLEQNDLLSVHDLPRSVKICDNHVPLGFLWLDTKIVTLKAGYPFLQSTLRANNEHIFLLFMAELTTAVLQHNKFFTCLSHIVETCMDYVLRMVHVS